jgi:hypothetical protein
MSTEPLDLALQHIDETKKLVERLILTSESFDYPAAKETLALLSQKVRLLGKYKAELQVQNLQNSSVVRPMNSFAPLEDRAPEVQP